MLSAPHVVAGDTLDAQPWTGTSLDFPEELWQCAEREQQALYGGIPLTERTITPAGTRQRVEEMNRSPW